MRPAPGPRPTPPTATPRRARRARDRSRGTPRGLRRTRTTRSSARRRPPRAWPQGTATGRARCCGADRRADTCRRACRSSTPTPRAAPARRRRCDRSAAAARRPARPVRGHRGADRRRGPTGTALRRARTPTPGRGRRRAPCRPVRPAHRRRGCPPDRGRRRARARTCGGRCRSWVRGRCRRACPGGRSRLRRAAPRPVRTAATSRGARRPRRIGARAGGRTARVRSRYEGAVPGESSSARPATNSASASTCARSRTPRSSAANEPAYTSSRVRHWSTPRTTPALREMRSHLAAGTGRPRPSSTGADANHAQRSSRAKSVSARANSLRRPRPSTEPDIDRVVAPLCAMSASSKCSCNSRAYGSSDAYNTAMRSSGTPARIASTTPRTIVRTSSSGSEAFHTSVPATGSMPTPAPARSPPRLGARSPGPPRRRSSEPVSPAMTSTLVCSDSARRSRAAGVLQRCGRKQTTVPSSRTSGLPCGGDVGGRPHQVVLVVPVALEDRLGRAVQTNDLARPRVLRGQHVELRGVEVGELAVRGDERLLGGGVLRDRREQTRRTRQRASHRRRHDRCRHRSAARGRELGRGEQLREPVDGEESDADDAAPGGAQRSELARREPSPRRHADRVGRHHHRHRRERVARASRARPRRATPATRRARTRSARPVFPRRQRARAERTATVRHPLGPRSGLRA